MNPALTGLSTGDMRVTLNYRNQNKNLVPFNTQAASFDMKILRGTLRRDVCAVGGAIVKDNQAAGALSSFTGLASMAYHKSLDQAQRNYVALGIQAGVFQRSMDVGKLSFGPQWTKSGGYDPSLSNGETFSNESSSVFDFHAGFMWYNFIRDNSSVFTGFSVYHAMQPKESFLGTDANIMRRLIWHGGRRIPLGEKLSIVPNFIWMFQNKANNLTLGTSAEYHLNPEKNTSIKAGVWYRYNSTSFVASLGMEIRDIAFGMSYDLYSKAQALSKTPGGLEFSLIYSPRMRSVVDLAPDPGTSF